ncbi:hypothetical protein [Streptomyces bottropensis]|uniref:hypothetical protein n=1 Tax=Streptomyces bottropensis TaxID=42235 RepID=UPI0036B0F279
MPALVFASAGGRKYHFDRACTAFESAQILSDWDCCCGDYCTHRSPRTHVLERMSSTKAAMNGKLPCLACVPQHLRELPQAETFAHEPVIGLTLFDQAETVCQRCTERGVWYSRGNDEMTPVRIPWPCTSAIVLGLVPRPTA